MNNVFEPEAVTDRTEIRCKVTTSTYYVMKGRKPALLNQSTRNDVSLRDILSSLYNGRTEKTKHGKFITVITELVRR